MTIAHETPMGISYCASMRPASLGVWRYKTVGGGYCSKSRDFAASTVEYLKVTWICWHTEDSHVMLFHNSRICSPQALQACACALFQPQKSPSTVVLWATEAWCILKKVSSLCGRDIPAKLKEPSVATQGSAEQIQERTGRVFRRGDQRWVGMTWTGFRKTFSQINAIYFLLLDFLVPHFSFTMSQKRPEY